MCRALYLRRDEVTDGKCRDKLLSIAAKTFEEYYVAPPGESIVLIVTAATSGSRYCFDRRLSVCEKERKNIYTLVHKNTWQYICDHDSRKTRLIFYEFCTAVSRKNIFTHT